MIEETATQWAIRNEAAAYSAYREILQRKILPRKFTINMDT